MNMLHQLSNCACILTNRRINFSTNQLKIERRVRDVKLVIWVSLRSWPFNWACYKIDSPIYQYAHAIGELIGHAQRFINQFGIDEQLIRPVEYLNVKCVIATEKNLFEKIKYEFSGKSVNILIFTIKLTRNTAQKSIIIELSYQNCLAIMVHRYYVHGSGTLLCILKICLRLCESAVNYFKVCGWRNCSSPKKWSFRWTFLNPFAKLRCTCGIFMNSCS